MKIESIKIVICDFQWNWIRLLKSQGGLCHSFCLLPSATTKYQMASAPVHLCYVQWTFKDPRKIYIIVYSTFQFMYRKESIIIVAILRLNGWTSTRLTGCKWLPEPIDVHNLNAAFLLETRILSISFIPQPLYRTASQQKQAGLWYFLGAGSQDALTPARSFIHPQCFDA